MTESQGIKTVFTRLRGFGFKVFNFNQRKANSKGIIGLPDWLIVKPKKYIVWVETKIGADTLSDGQKEIVEMLSFFAGLPNSPIHVMIIKTAKEAERLQEQLLTNKL